MEFVKKIKQIKKFGTNYGIKSMNIKSYNRKA